VNGIILNLRYAAGLKKHFLNRLNKLSIITGGWLMPKLKEVDRQILDSCLMIDGHTIGNCMKNPKLEGFFFEVACKAPVVCVC